MRIGGFGKSFIGGALGATLAVGVSVALAGTGVGGIFNLGQSNVVDETSTLAGSKDGPQLTVKNISTGANSTPLNLIATSGKPALTLNTVTRIPSLNADMVDGYHASWFSRVGMTTAGVPLTNDAGATKYSLQTAQILVPQPGFVRVDGSLTFNDLFSGTPCHYCRIAIRLRDDTTGATSQYAFANLGKEGGVRDIETMSQDWVFPATKGTHSYTLLAEVLGSGGTGPPQFYDYKVIVQFLPFGYAGGGSGLAPDPAPCDVCNGKARTK